MRKFLLAIISFLMLFTNNCAPARENTKPYILLSSGENPLNTGQIRIERRFISGQKIYYLLVVPDGFKKPGIRMQLSKQEEKTSNWGFSIIQSKDLYIDKSHNSYKNYFILRQKGNYILQFFYLNNKQYPFAHREFTVE